MTTGLYLVTRVTHSFAFDASLCYESLPHPAILERASPNELIPQSHYLSTKNPRAPCHCNVMTLIVEESGSSCTKPVTLRRPLQAPLPLISIPR